MEKKVIMQYLKDHIGRYEMTQKCYLYWGGKREIKTMLRSVKKSQNEMLPFYDGTYSPHFSRSMRHIAFLVKEEEEKNDNVTMI